MFGPGYFGDGGDIVAVVAEETLSGGWRRRAGHSFREETQTDRQARIHAERIRLGILPPEPSDPDADTTRSIHGDTARGLSTGLSTGLPTAPPYSLAGYLLPEDLAGLEALAARAAELSMDAEIALWLRLDEQRRLHEAWLRDEDDAAVLMLAIATIH